MQKARERWLMTQQWRKEYGADSILERPHPKFDIIKAAAPTFWTGRDKSGVPVYYELMCADPHCCSWGVGCA
jgi:hypothetical protein